jgi:hypothetical protein
MWEKAKLEGGQILTVVRELNYRKTIGFRM